MKVAENPFNPFVDKKMSRVIRRLEENLMKLFFQSRKFEEYFYRQTNRKGSANVEQMFYSSLQRQSLDGLIPNESISWVIDLRHKSLPKRSSTHEAIKSQEFLFIAHQIFISLKNFIKRRFPNFTGFVRRFDFWCWNVYSFILLVLRSTACRKSQSIKRRLGRVRLKSSLKILLPSIADSCLKVETSWRLNKETSSTLWFETWRSRKLSTLWTFKIDRSWSFDLRNLFRELFESFARTFHFILCFRNDQTSFSNPKISCHFSEV